MKRLLAVLLLTSCNTPAPAESCRINGIPCDFAITVSVPTQPPQTPSCSTSCVSPNYCVGEVCTAPVQPPQPSVCAPPLCVPWEPMLTTTLFRIPPDSASGVTGRSVQFLADPASPGIILKTVDESGGNIALPKEVVISAAPHTFVPVAANCRNYGNISAFVINMRYSTGGAAQPYDCALTAGTTYFIDIRAADQVSTVWFQFAASTYPAAPPKTGR